MAKAITGTKGMVRLYSGYDFRGIETTLEAEARIYGGLWAVHHRLRGIESHWSAGVHGVNSQVYAYSPLWGDDYDITHIPTGMTVQAGMKRNVATALAKHLAQAVPDAPGAFGVVLPADALRPVAAVVSQWWQEQRERECATLPNTGLAR